MKRKDFNATATATRSGPTTLADLAQRLNETGNEASQARPADVAVQASQAMRIAWLAFLATALTLAVVLVWIIGWQWTTTNLEYLILFVCGIPFLVVAIVLSFSARKIAQHTWTLGAILRRNQELIWEIEKALRTDLDGDGHHGQPATTGNPADVGDDFVVNTLDGQKTIIPRAKTIPIVRKTLSGFPDGLTPDDVIYVLETCLSGESLAFGKWVGRSLPSGWKASTNEDWRAVQNGLIAWRFASSERRGMRRFVRHNVNDLETYEAMVSSIRASVAASEKP